MATEVLDEALADGLRQARKKPRNFAIVVKGSKALKLLVRKKPIKPAELVEAKAEVKGTGFVTGVCQGDGSEMVFRVVGEEPSVKTTQLKELIGEQSGLTMKARFEVVAELKEVDDGSDDAGGALDAGAGPAATLPVAPAAPPAAGAADAGAQDAAWKAAVAGIEPRYQEVLRGQPANATALRATWDFAGEQAAAGKYAAGITALARLKKMLDEAQTSGAAKQTDVIPEGIVQERVRQIETLYQNWRTIRVRSVEGLDELVGVLQTSDDQELGEIGSRVQALVKSIPEQIEASLAGLSKAIGSRDAGATKAQKLKVQADLKQCAEYLKENQKAIACCEENPFGIAVSIHQPLAQSLREILASLQAV